MERTEFGHKFVDHQFEDTQFSLQTREGWISTDGNTVIVASPLIQDLYWRVFVPHMEQSHPINGEMAEERAFSVAVGFIEQVTSHSKNR